jgi:cytidylate kinase
MNRTNVAVAIDGPSGAGKSTISKRIAQDMGFIYVDTGALYRAVGLYIWKNKISFTDTGRIISLLPDIKVSLAYTEGGQRVFLNGEDVTNSIRTLRFPCMLRPFRPSPRSEGSFSPAAGARGS